MLSNTIFSKGNCISYFLPNEIGQVLGGLNKCQVITQRVAQKSQNHSFKEGSDCLNKIYSEIDEIGSELLSKQTFCR